MQPLLDAVIFTIFDGSANGDNEILETDDETSVSKKRKWIKSKNW